MRKGTTGLLNQIKAPIAKATNERSENTSQLDSSLDASTMQALRHDVTERQDCRLGLTSHRQHMLQLDNM